MQYTTMPKIIFQPSNAILFSQKYKSQGRQTYQISDVFGGKVHAFHKEKKIRYCTCEFFTQLERPWIRSSTILLENLVFQSCSV